MGLNQLGRDKTYDSISAASTDIEKISLVIEILKKSKGPIYLKHKELRIPPEQISLFEAKLIETGLVEANKTGIHYTFKINNKGLLKLENRTYLDFIGANMSQKFEKRLITPAIKDRLLQFLCENAHLENRSEGKPDDILNEFEIEFNEFEGIMSQFQRYGFIYNLDIRTYHFSFFLKIEAHDFLRQGGFIASEEIFKANIEKLGYEIDKLKKDLPQDLLETANKISAISSTIIAGLSLIKN